MSEWVLVAAAELRCCVTKRASTSAKLAVPQLQVGEGHEGAQRPDVAVHQHVKCGTAHLRCCRDHPPSCLQVHTSLSLSS